MRRTFTLFVCQLLLWAVVAQLNDSLSDGHVYLFPGALFLTFAALTQPFGSGLAATILIGLVCDANAPVAFGTHMLLFATTHVLLWRLRDRVTRDDTIGRVVVAILANLGLFLVFSFIELIRTPMVSGLWPRLICDLLCSQVFLAVVAPWFFALQARSLVLARAERENFA